MYGSTVQFESLENPSVQIEPRNADSKFKYIKVATAAVALIMVAALAIDGGKSFSSTQSNPETKLVARGSKSTTTDFEISSTSFVTESTLPTIYTCDGSSINPPFEWSNLPDGTEALVFIMSNSTSYTSYRDDWVLFNIPTTQSSISQACVVPDDYTSCGGYNGGTYPGKPFYYYTAPCSPGAGPRTYFWLLYALSKEVDTSSLVAGTQDDAYLNGYEYAGLTAESIRSLMADDILDVVYMETTYTRDVDDDTSSVDPIHQF